MNKNTICNYILKYAEQQGCPPTHVVKPHLNFIGIAWNTHNYYFDIEIKATKVEASLSKDRKVVEFITIDEILHPSTDEDLHKILDEIFMTIKGF